MQYAKRLADACKEKVHSANSVENEEIARVRRSLGAVARILSKREVDATPEAAQAVRDEYDQATRTKRAFDLSKPMEREDIIKKHPNGFFVRAYCVTVGKGVHKSGLRK